MRVPASWLPVAAGDEFALARNLAFAFFDMSVYDSSCSTGPEVESREYKFKVCKMVCMWI